MSHTFIFENQDHTIGNAIRAELLKNPQVEFAGYKNTHPLQRQIQLAVVSENPEDSLATAVRGLKKQIKTLEQLTNDSLVT